MNLNQKFALYTIFTDHAVKIVTNPVRTGKYAAKFNLKKEDILQSSNTIFPLFNVTSIRLVNWISSARAHGCAQKNTSKDIVEKIKRVCHQSFVIQ